ncbi:hypothetical protein RB623_20375 [Mesorhizobium sp. LHD-90]|uniref:hypothetical protein n=1 Tax=Mesorhizobium sp. LHD-90 TaxID=3071414 RepID=UPI0027E07F31|nr:hypothetical protein [Mesorhizobium sp. LHD-90]MDQ6436413.1 hypothetical protein [Mesorhizobium sp. LHD-90]
MFKLIRTAALSAAVGLTALTGMAATAQADGLYLNFGGRNDTRVGVYVGEDGPRHVGQRWDRDRWDRGRWERDRWERRGCTPNRAVEKARRLGLRRAHVIDVGRRTIDVAGRRYGERFVLTFARVPGCPVIR